MSQALEEGRIPSDVELADELVKDLQESCNLESEPDNEEDTTSVTDDFVDEVALKDRDLTLSDSDKEKLKEESETLKNKGNELFKEGKWAESVTMYTEGLRTCPLVYNKARAVLYANRAAAESKIGRTKAAIDDCTSAIECDPCYVKVILRRAALYEADDKLDEAFEDFKKVLELDRSNATALQAAIRLPPMIEERNEKLKTEMLGKLKDLGNVILKPFGLSTNNFQMTQDPNSGGYSINFKQ